MVKKFDEFINESNTTGDTYNKLINTFKPISRDYDIEIDDKGVIKIPLTINGDFAYTRPLLHHPDYIFCLDVPTKFIDYFDDYYDIDDLGKFDGEEPMSSVEDDNGDYMHTSDIVDIISQILAHIGINQRALMKQRGGKSKNHI